MAVAALHLAVLQRITNTTPTNHKEEEASAQNSRYFCFSPLSASQ